MALEDDLRELKKEIEDEPFRPQQTYVGNRTALDRIRSQLRNLHPRQYDPSPEPKSEPARHEVVRDRQSTAAGPRNQDWIQPQRSRQARNITLAQAVDKGYVEPEIDLSRFVELLKRHRKRLGLSQPDLAEAVGCDHSYISRIEGKTRRPSVQIVEKMALALGLPRDEREEFFLAAGYAVGSNTVPLPKELAELRVYFEDGVLQPNQLAWARQQLALTRSALESFRGTNLLGEEQVY